MTFEYAFHAHTGFFIVAAVQRAQLILTMEKLHLLFVMYLQAI